jgi:hypothetical protein
MSDDLFAPAGGWRVRILDLTGGAEDGITEEVSGFPSLMQANAFARAYVRDSIEHCREPGLASRDVLARWFAMGEDAEVLDAGDQGWRGRWNGIGGLWIRGGTKRRSKKALLFCKKEAKNSCKFR